MRFDVVVAFASIALAACTWDTPLPTLPPPPAGAPTIRAHRELVVTDDAVLGSLSSNGSDGALSFNHRMNLIVDAPNVEGWLLAWEMRLREDKRPDRADLLASRVRCAWLRRNELNACDDACTCTNHILRASDAPFRLVAVVNRTDLADMPDRKGAGGEGRLVYAVTDGPADDPASAALPLTVIFEYEQNESNVNPAKSWARRWHLLADAADDAFGTALVGVVAAFGSIAQVRTADALGGPLVMHQFELVESAGLLSNIGSGAQKQERLLEPRGVRNTPDWSSVTEDELRRWALGSGDDLVRGTAVMPASWWGYASAADDVTPAWLGGIANHDRITDGTCAGCHAKSESGFQIDPQKSGAARLSKFLVDPTASEDELRRRTLWLQRKMVEPDPVPKVPSYSGGW